MKKSTYDTIKSSMPDSLRMKLEHIKRYLDVGKAAVFVGAGFSKNAQMPEHAEMKDWNALGLDFYRKLYGEPEVGSLMFQNPINLATQVEASFGRHELDSLIEQSLPDDVIVHSPLHVSLLNLGWHDVFTTNYDTLLERACLDADKPYTVVYNKDTLLYSRSPRIVKLHGSFPNIHPYIITEEDYRTYPQCYPEFVNTVRQSLIENLFCMVGFSGDDPNFKSWLGWLRDVMGKNISPVYFVTYDSNLHDSRRNLLAQQRIEVLNLHDLPNVDGLQQAFEFLFQYLKTENQSQWSLKLKKGLREVKTADQLKEVTKEMAAIRNSYPGWLILPEKYYSDCRDVVSEVHFCGKIREMEGLKKETLYRFYYELCWRLQVTLTPMNVDWMVEAFEAIPMEEMVDNAMLGDVKLSLLSYYRLVGKEREYEKLAIALDKQKNELKPFQLRRLCYDRCLMALSRLDYEKVNTILNSWQVYETDFVGALWKAAVMAEVDQMGDALNLLNKASEQVRRAILSSQKESFFYKSCQVAIERSLNMLGRHYNPYNKYPNCDYVDEIRFFREKSKDDSGEKKTTKSHGFNVGDVRTTWHMGSAGYVNEYLYGYRFYALCEQVGMPVGVPEMTINSNDHKLYLPILLKYNHYFPIGVMLRSCSGKLVDEVLGRKEMALFSRDIANDSYDLLNAYLQKANKKNKLEQIHIQESCIPVMVRMCSKTSTDRVKRLADYLIEAHSTLTLSEEQSEAKNLKTLYNALPMADLNEIIGHVFEQPIILSPHYENDIFCPVGYTEGVTFSSLAVQQALDGLNDDNAKVQEAAFLRAYQLLRGVLKDEDRRTLKEAIVKWRNATTDMEHVCFSYIDVPETEGERYSQKVLFDKFLKELLQIDVSNGRNSSMYDKISNLLYQINRCKAQLADFVPTDIIALFCKLITDNRSILDDDEVGFFMGGFRNNVTNVVNSFIEFLSMVDLSGVSADLIQSLTNTAYVLRETDYPYMSILILTRRYNRDLKEADLKNEMLTRITDSARLAQAMDIGRSIKVLRDENRSCQSQVHQIISLCEYSQSDNVRSWLYVLYYLVVQNVVKEQSNVKLMRLLEIIHQTDNYSETDANRLSDNRFYTSLIAGALAKLWGETKQTKAWKQLSENGTNEFNDISMAYWHGWREVEKKNKEKTEKKK